MSVSVTMPRLGESVTEGTVTRWLKKEGERVEVDEPLLEVSTDKVDTEIPSPAAGVLSSIKVQEDETVEVGVELAVIGDEGGAAPAAAAPEPAAAPPPPPAAEPEPAPAPVAPPVTAVEAPSQTPVFSAPEAAAAPPAPAAPAPVASAPAPVASAPAPVASAPAPAAVGSAPAPAAAVPAAAAALRGKTEPMTRLRKVIAQRMRESLQVSAQLTTVLEADVTNIAKLRDAAKRDFEAREGVKLSFLPFFTLAAIEALKAHPMVNASIDEAAGTVTYHEDVNLGIAVDTDRGLLVPVIGGAGDLNLSGVARKIADLADRTRTNQVTPDELGGGTFTITNTGSRGALFDTPIINQPQVGILGTGVVVKRPVVVKDSDGGETIAIRSMVYLALSYDHRVVDGADAARFLTTINERLEAGAFEADLGL
jgi:2-oxoglutarate dehydrogenase E2 component (dihydrolipoamide succinyltransferase)